MLTRYFIRSASDSLRIVPYVVIAGGITSIYAIWQNLRFMAGKNAFEVMAGRPNATFAEADWLGMWLVLMGALLLTLLWRAERWTSWREAWSRRGVLWLGGWLLGVVMTMSLFLTVARSAWLAMILMALVFGTGLFVATLRGHISWPELFLKKSLLSSAVLVAGGLVYGLHLTNFPLWQRVQSTGGWQEITIACSMPEATLPPERIQNVQELDQYSCRHINLEEVDQERRQGQFITRVERPDPNVAVRASIYTQVWETLRQRPLQGIGWGNDGVILGEDARGASLNASNIFLEVWLGSGVIGLGIFVWLWGWIVWASLRVIQQGMDRDRQSLGWCMLFSWIGLTVANFFNAGILLGFLWVWLALGVVTVKSYAYRN
jgi:hypothetical protein